MSLGQDINKINKRLDLVKHHLALLAFWDKKRNAASSEVRHVCQLHVSACLYSVIIGLYAVGWDKTNGAISLYFLLPKFRTKVDQLKKGDAPITSTLQEILGVLDEHSKKFTMSLKEQDKSSIGNRIAELRHTSAHLPSEIKEVEVLHQELIDTCDIVSSLLRAIMILETYSIEGNTFSATGISNIRSHEDFVPEIKKYIIIKDEI